MERADREPSSTRSGFPRVYRPVPVALWRARLVLILGVAFFLAVSLRQTLLLLTKPGLWIVAVVTGVTFLSLILFLIWVFIRLTTVRVVFDADSLAVANFFGQKRLRKADIAGARLGEGQFPAVRGTSLAWLRRKGFLEIVPSAPNLRPLRLPQVVVDPAFDEWVGGLAVLGSKSADIPVVAPGTLIRDAPAGISAATAAVRIPYMTIALLVLLGAAFVAELMFPGGVGGGGLQVSPTPVALGGVNRVLVVQYGQWYRVLSAVFLHAGVFHLAMNGLVLLFAGWALERQVGRAWLAALFIISGIGASLMSITLNPPALLSIGASGAIMGLLAAMFVLASRQSSRAARWQQRAALLRLLIPALLPAASTRHIDVADHLGGAIAGAMVGMLILANWPRELALPRHRKLAGGIVAASLLILPIGLMSGLAAVRATPYLLRAAAAQSDSAALADCDRAITIAPGFAPAYEARGLILFARGQYDAAAADFRKLVSLLPAWSYGTLLLHLSNAHLGVEDASEFSSNATGLDLMKWPGPILALYLGKIPLAAIPAAAMAGDQRTRNGRMCEASFYMGEYEALYGQISHAKELIRQAAETCPADFIEYKLAKAELPRLASIGGEQRARLPPPQAVPPAAAPVPRAASPSSLAVAELLERARHAHAEKDYSEAMRWYRMAADQGNPAAQNNLGELYENGWGVPQNYPEAMRWFRKAADQGNPAAQNAIGVLYANGRGVPRDYAEALRWFGMAAAQGHPPAESNIGVLYESGWGVQLDYARAMSWFRMAAEQGNAIAQNKVGLLYQRGRGVPPDPVEAVRWFQMAAAQGNAAAQTNVGWMIAHGAGVPKDCAAARQWFEKAAAAGNDGARRSLGSGVEGACFWTPAAPMVDLTARRRRIKAIVGELRSCLSAVRSKPVYDTLLPHLRDLRDPAFTATQLADDRTPSPADARALGAYIDEGAHCKEKWLAGIDQMLPESALIRKQLMGETQTILLQLVTRKLTWGAAAQQAQQLLESADGRNFPNTILW